MLEKILITLIGTLAAFFLISRCHRTMRGGKPGCGSGCNGCCPGRARSPKDDNSNQDVGCESYKGLHPG